VNYEKMRSATRIEKEEGFLNTFCMRRRPGKRRTTAAQRRREKAGLRGQEREEREGL